MVERRADDDLASTHTEISGTSSIFMSWLVAGACNAASLQQSLGFFVTTTRLLQHAFDAGHFAALGLASAGLCGAYRRYVNAQSRIRYVVLAIGSCALGALFLPPDLSKMAERIAGDYGSFAKNSLLAVSTIAITLSVPIAHALGRLLARPWWRWLAMAVGVTILTTHAIVLKDFYHAIHFWMAATGATLFASALAGAVLPITLTNRLARFATPHVRNAVLALLAAYAAFAIGRRPPSATAIALVRNDGSLLPHFLLRFVHPPTPLRQADIPPDMKPWFEDRKNHPPIAPTVPPVITDKPIIILMTIDCTRADVIMSRKNDDLLRSLARLRDISTTFTHARSTAPGTSSSLASVFFGSYFSQQYWAPPKARAELYADDSPRLSEILGHANITTVTYTGAPGLTPRFGLLRGFTESTDLQKDSRYARAEDLMKSGLERLKRANNDALFLYLHFLDAHAPYDRGLKTGSPFDRYISELQLVDKQLGQLMALIQSHSLRNRMLLIVSADHGEAFGEHGTTYHSSSIYDELLRVPLLIWRPGHQPFVVDDPVSLVDLGPTILDLFGVPTPGHFMGQSLVPYLRRDKPKLTRPILAEGRLKQALILPDGQKVIVDNRMNTVELYDLRTDPGETNSLADDEERLSTPLSLLRQFFQVHANRTPGYSPPYRVW